MIVNRRNGAKKKSWAKYLSSCYSRNWSRFSEEVKERTSTCRFSLGEGMKERASSPARFLSEPPIEKNEGIEDEIELSHSE